MSGWGSANAARYLRLVFANEPIERLRGIGRRFQSAL
jgi:N-succinyldiaminopimelate aminotransferase